LTGSSSRRGSCSELMRFRWYGWLYQAMLGIGPVIGIAALLWLHSDESHRLIGSTSLAILAAPVWLVLLSLPIMGVGSAVFVLHALRRDLEAGMTMLVEHHCAPLLARGRQVEIEATPILAGALPHRLERLGFQRRALHGRARATMTLTWIAGLREPMLMRAFTFGSLHWVGLPPLALYRTTGAALVERWGGNGEAHVRERRPRVSSGE